MINSKANLYNEFLKFYTVLYLEYDLNSVIYFDSLEVVLRPERLHSFDCGQLTDSRILNAVLWIFLGCVERIFKILSSQSTQGAFRSPGTTG